MTTYDVVGLGVVGEEREGGCRLPLHVHLYAAGALPPTLDVEADVGGIGGDDIVVCLPEYGVVPDRPVPASASFTPPSMLLDVSGTGATVPMKPNGARNAVA